MDDKLRKHLIARYIKLEDEINEMSFVGTEVVALERLVATIETSRFREIATEIKFMQGIFEVYGLNFEQEVTGL